jgi:hypothetical protein
LNQALEPVLLKAAFVPLTLADFFIRNTTAINPITRQRALDRILESGFHSHWLDPEHVTPRWFLTNFNRLTRANKALLTSGIPMIFFSELLEGKTTNYFSTASFRLYHQDKRLPL